ncbi:MAG: hypothetical protein CL607_04875 [Anaerolineaceae bacterium]|nr:hypothetical protein [Anaerolineaceae bacterium]
MFVAKKFVVITKHNQFALEVSQLNARGTYQVETFSSANNALQFLHRNAQDAVIIDFDRLDVAGELLIEAIRARQPDIAIILAPDDDEMQALVDFYNIQALIRIPFPVRQLVNVVQSSIQSMYDAQPDTVTIPATDDQTPESTDDVVDTIDEDEEFDESYSDDSVEKGDTPAIEVRAVDTGPLSDTPPPFDPLGDFTPVPPVIPKYRDEIDPSDEVEQPSEEAEPDPHARFRPPPLHEAAQPNAQQDAQHEIHEQDDAEQQYAEWEFEDWEEDEPDGQEPESSDNSAVFERLRAEEPPLPSFEQSGTVRDIFDTGAHEWEAPPTDPPQDTTERSTAAAMPFEPSGKSQSIPAAIILDRATDDSTPLEGFSITQFMQRIKEEFPQGEAHILPLPSWVEEAERYISEPDFLDEDMPERSVDYTSATTAPNVPADTANIGEWGTERIEPMKRSRATDEPTESTDSRPPTMPEMPPVPSERPSTMPEMPTAASDEEIKAASEEVTQPAIFDEYTDELTSSGPTSADPSAELEEAEAAYEDESQLEEEVSYDDFEFVVADEDAADEDLAEDVSDEWDDEAVAEPAAQAQPQPVPEPVYEEPEITEDEETYFARIALTLTQVSLELAGDATILAQDGELVAHAGPMPIGDIEEMLPILQQDWETKPERGRIRFVHQASTGQDYMLYSRMAEGGFVLSMLFAGAQSIGMIREQAQRMLDSLASVPEREVDEPSTAMEAILDEPVEEVATEDIAEVSEEPEVHDEDIGYDEDLELDASLAREPIAFVWIVRDTRMTLPQEATDLLANTLGEYLLRAQWDVKELLVESDYVYLFADVPGENLLGNAELADLMQASAQILAESYPAMEPDTLWADSYMVLTPGRALNTEDIQRFINFARR